MIAFVEVQAHGTVWTGLLPQKQTAGGVDEQAGVR